VSEVTEHQRGVKKGCCSLSRHKSGINNDPMLQRTIVLIIPVCADLSAVSRGFLACNNSADSLQDIKIPQKPHFLFKDSI